MSRARRKVLPLSLALLATVLVLSRLTARPLPREALPRQAIAGVEEGLARVVVDSGARALEVVVGPVAIAARTPGLRTPIQLVELPVGGMLHGFSWRITDAAGRSLPRDLLHHVNLIDPDRRDLFSTTARRVIAAGRETGEQSFTPLVGYPLTAGTRLLVVAMFANDGDAPVPEAYLRLRLALTPERRLLRPLPVFPFTLDVMGPVGEKSFPVPPGRTVRSWEGSPAVDARILALGGHLHDHGVLLRLEDVTRGRVLWEAKPVTEDGRLVAVPVGMPWKRGGIRLRADRRYRVTAVYVNGTRQPGAHGGMGVVAGLAHVARGWPPADPGDPDYRADLASVVAAPRRAAAGDDHRAHVH